MMNSLFNSFGDFTESSCSDGLPPEGYAKAGCTSVLITFAVMIAAVVLSALLGSCSAKERVVTMHEVRDVHHWHTDTLRQTDSTVIERETIIRQADSSVLARYGIEMQSAQRAWLIQTRELERQIQQMKHDTAVRDTVHDSIPYVVPAPASAVGHESWWRRLLEDMASAVLFMAAVWVTLRYIIPMLLKR